MQFLQFDTTELRAVLLDKLEYVFVKPGTQGCNIDEPVGCVRCTLLDDSGVQCDWTGKSQAALVHHQVLSKKANHGVRSVACLFTVTNQCCICMSVFADKVTAQHHVNSSIKREKMQHR